jgi:hypothetical protein
MRMRYNSRVFIIIHITITQHKIASTHRQRRRLDFDPYVVEEVGYDVVSGLRRLPLIDARVQVLASGTI